MIGGPALACNGPRIRGAFQSAMGQGRGSRVGRVVGWAQGRDPWRAAARADRPNALARRA